MAGEMSSLLRMLSNKLIEMLRHCIEVITVDKIQVLWDSRARIGFSNHWKLQSWAKESKNYNKRIFMKR